MNGRARNVTCCTAALICAVCGDALVEAGRLLECPRRHTFDRAREGYVHMLPTGHGRSKIRGDTVAMVHARRRVLERGFYDPLYRSIDAHVAEHRIVPRTAARALTVADVGCGPGHFIARLTEQVPAGAGDDCFFGIDISKDALRLAARAHPQVCFLLNDVGHRICLADDTVDILLDVFAPRNPAEFGRVIRPGGLLLVAIPAENHLIELRRALPMLGIQADKRERVVDQFAGVFECIGEEMLEYPVALDAQLVRDLVTMSPSHWHVRDSELAGADAFAGSNATVAIRLLRFRPIAGAAS